MGTTPWMATISMFRRFSGARRSDGHREGRAFGARVSLGVIAHGAPIVYFTFPGLAALGVAHAATTRHLPGARPFGDPSAPFGPEAGRALAPAGLDLGRVAFARQVHGVEVARVTKPGHV